MLLRSTHAELSRAGGSVQAYLYKYIDKLYVVTIDGAFHYERGVWVPNPTKVGTIMVLGVNLAKFNNFKFK